MAPKRKSLHDDPDHAPHAPLDKPRHVVGEARPRLARDEYTVGWICAIDTEYVAGQALMDEKHERHHNLPLHDASHYTLGRIGPHNIVMAVLPEYGTSAATAVARDMLHSFPQVRIGLMVGIGGGAPTQNNDIRLGDIVVGTARNGQSSVVQYDFGKAVQGQSFQQTGSLNQPPQRLRGATVGLRARYKKDGHQIEETIKRVLDDNPNLRTDHARPSPESDKLYRSTVVHPPQSEGSCAAVCGIDPSKLVQRPARAVDKLVVHYGVIASANQVMKDALTRDKLAAENDFLCFEMEAAGLSNNLPCIVIRGICDYSDSHKNKEWQGYAAMAAAVYAKDLLNELSPHGPLSSAPTPNESWNSGTAIHMQTLLEKRKKQLLESLTFNQIDVRHLTIKRAHAQTCKWVLKSAEYLDWLDDTKRNQHHGFLWIKGKPGTGKSTLMKFIATIYGRKMQQCTRITFFFNARGEYLEKSTLGMYRSLLFQLIESLPRLQTIVDSPKLVTPIAEPRQWTLETLEDLFEEAILNLGDSSVTCFIDALDECDQGEIGEMVSFFKRIGESTTQKRVYFQVCFSSRHYPQIKIPKAVSLVLEEQQGHQDDIVNYVSSELEIGNGKIGQEIRHDLQEKASGVFMWVVLVVDIMNKEYNGGRVHRLRRRLREIPSDLHKLFRDILIRDCDDREDLLLCFQWVLFAKEPLSPEELYFAILSGNGVNLREALSDWESGDITTDLMKRFILDSSRGLTEVTKSKDPTVQFIHESVRDFLLKDDGLSQIWSEFRSSLEGECHERLKSCCLNYLTVATSMEVGNTLPNASATEADRLREAAQKRLPFLPYATKQVMYHSDTAEGAGVSQASFLESFDLSKWVVLDNLLERHRIRRHTPNASLLYILAEHDRANLIRIERSNLECFKVEDERYGAPILAALATGGCDAVYAFLTAHKDNNPESLALKGFQTSSHQQKGGFNKTARDLTFSTKKGLLSHVCELGNEMIVALLLELGEAGFDVSHPQFRRGILHAAKAGHLAICQFFMENDQIDIDQQDENGLTPFCHASKQGHDAIVALLLETGRVDIENKDKRGRTAFSHASGNGHTAIIRLLIETGQVDIEKKDKDGRTAFSHACENGHHVVAKLLIESFAIEVDSRCKSGRTPLSYAARASGRPPSTIVKFILDSTEADVNSQDVSGRTPLSYAMGYGSDNVKQLLATDDIEVDLRDDSGRTPFSYAAGNSGPQSFKLLLDTGKVEVDSRDNSGRTPLSHAAGGMFEGNVKLLLETGKVAVESQDMSSRTPLSYAAQSGKLETVSLLLATGQASPSSEDENGRTPLSYATQRSSPSYYHQDAIVKLLESHTS